MWLVDFLSLLHAIACYGYAGCIVWSGILRWLSRWSHGQRGHHTAIAQRLPASGRNLKQEYSKKVCKSEVIPKEFKNVQSLDTSWYSPAQSAVQKQCPATGSWNIIAPDVFSSWSLSKAFLWSDMIRWSSGHWVANWGKKTITPLPPLIETLESATL